MPATVDRKNVIAIGDVHGMSDALADLLAHLEPRFDPADTQFVLLGDIIDRGPNSRGVISMIIDLFGRYPGSQLVLGNHDAYFLDMLNSAITEFDLNQWAHMGGLETMQEYLFEPPNDIHDIRGQILQVAPSHYELLKAAVSMVLTHRHCFVHAGIDPTLRLSEQEPAKTRWIRKGFLDSTEPLERIVVHGHSITPSFLPEVLSNRIALDTGSYKSARISAAIFVHDILVEFVCARQQLNTTELLRFDSRMAPFLD